MKHFGVVPGQQDVGLACGQDHGLVGRGVQRLEVVQRNLRQFGRQRDVYVAADRHAGEIRVVPDGGQLRVEGLWLHHNVFDGLQLGNIQPGLGRHGQIQVAGPQPFLPVARDGTTDAAFAPVVSGQRQMPVAKHAVEPLQIVQCGPGAGQHVAAVILKNILLELKAFTGGRHELPHARRLGARDGLRVESALHKGQ